MIKNITHKILKNINKCLVLFSYIVIMVYLIACEEVVPPDAEITKVYNITDTSAYVDIKVYQQPQALAIEGFGIEVYFDSVTNNNGISPKIVQYINIMGSNNTINTSYTTIISHLKCKTQYSVNLYFGGEVFGGPNYVDYFNGSSKTFTTY